MHFSISNQSCSRKEFTKRETLKHERLQKYQKEKHETAKTSKSFHWNTQGDEPKRSQAYCIEILQEIIVKLMLHAQASVS